MPSYMSLNNVDDKNRFSMCLAAWKLSELILLQHRELKAGDTIQVFYKDTDLQRDWIDEIVGLTATCLNEAGMEISFSPDVKIIGTRLRELLFVIEVI